MAPVSGCLILLLLFCAGTLADDYKPPVKPSVDKPGSCPIPSTRCRTPLPRGKCSSDRDCSGEKKCCVPLCIPTCTKPIPVSEPWLDASSIPLLTVEDTSQTTRKSSPLLVSFTAEKPGKCPVVNTFAPCATPYPEPKCFSDQQCGGTNKCCDYGCQRMCVPPV